MRSEEEYYKREQENADEHGKHEADLATKISSVTHHHYGTLTLRNRGWNFLLYCTVVHTH